jgi:predicted Rossmann fold nucleotide-binding protein DprA/Smf involved in DNA uptake
MKLLITGSRTFDDKTALFKALDGIEFDTLISGGAKGADSIAEEYCLLNGIEVAQYLPEYDKFGRGAPIVRNKSMVALCDTVLAVWDGQSKGTKSTIDFAKKSNKNIQILSF